MSEPTITVELTHYEARALANTANLWAESMRDITEALRRPGQPVSPLVSGAMKLEMTLIGEGAAL